MTCAVDTGTEHAAVVLSVLVGMRSMFPPLQAAQYRDGEQHYFISFSLIAGRCGLSEIDVPTVLLFLHCAGAIDIRPGSTTTAGAKICLQPQRRVGWLSS